MILAGGIGSRFWPVSTPTRPKQLLPLAGERPLIRETVDRILPLVGVERVRVIAGRHLTEPILAAVPGLKPACLMPEPIARGTAPALAWAAAEIRRAEPDAVMLSLHADHVIEPAQAFRDVLHEAATAAAEHERLFTIGAQPTRAEPGYGYIEPGDALAHGSAAREVRSFTEKPTKDVAQEYIRAGFLWNTGIFALPVGLFLDEIGRHTPEIAPLLPLLEAGDTPAFFERAPALTIDNGLLERSTRVAVIPARFRWDDVGAWDAVGRTRTLDAAGNVVVGDAYLVDSSGCIVWADEGSIVTFGTQDLVVVTANGITFIAPRDRAPELKRLLDALPPQLREPGGASR